MKFSWKAFFSRMGMRESVSRERWTQAIKRLPSDDEQCAAQFLYLAYRDGQDSHEHVADSGYFDKYQLPGIIDGNFGHKYFYRENKHEFLRRGLQMFGAELLRVKWPNGQLRNQYLRTIRRYSGSMYVQFADVVSNIVRSNSWNKVMEPGFLENQRLLDDKFRQYFDENEEDRKTKSDIVCFFEALARQYRRYNKPFSKVDVQELIPVAEGVAQRLIDKMCVSNGMREASGLGNLDTLPSLTLTKDGKPVYQLPETGHFGDGVEQITYLFKESPTSSETIASAYYRRRQDGTFVREWDEGFAEGVPFADVGAIIRRRNAVGEGERETGRKTVDEDVMPLYLKDQTQGHVLLSLRDIETGCGYALDTKRGTAGIVTTTSCLVPGRYKILSFDGEILPLSFFKDDRERLMGESERRTYESDGVFSVPIDVDAVQVGDCMYLCENEGSRYFEVEVRSRFVRRPGSRLYYTNTVYPFSEYYDSVRAGDRGLTVHYVVPNEGIDETLPANESEWEVPENCLWKKGWVSFRLDGNEKYRRAVTFIEEPWSRELEEAFDLARPVTAQVRLGDRYIDVSAGENDTQIRFSFKGIELVMPILRKGVFFDCAGRTLPLRRDEPGQNVFTDIAVRDFEKTCHVLTDETNAIVAVRGVNAFAKLDNPLFRGTELMSLPSLKEENDQRYALCVGKDGSWDYYRFRVYDPTKTFVEDEGLRRVETSRENDDLIVKYLIAFSDAGGRKSMAYYPAHRQEQEICWIEPDEAVTLESTTDAFGRCVETLRLRGFYTREIDWGEGLLCYVGRRMPIPNQLKFNIEAFTSGFFLRRPPDVTTDTLLVSDDPSGIRLAMAQKDYLRVEEILKNAEKNCDMREYFTGDNGFLKKLQNESKRVKGVLVNGKRESGRNFMNAYRNVLKRPDGTLEVSGYVFAARWYYARLVDGRNRMPEGLRDSWSPLMFSWSELGSTNHVPLYPEPVYPTTSQLDYLPVAEKKRFRVLVERVNGHSAANSGHFLYQDQERAFNYVRFAEAVRVEVHRGTPFETLLARANPVTPKDWEYKYLKAMYRCWGKATNDVTMVKVIRSRLFDNVDIDKDDQCLSGWPNLGQSAFLRKALENYRYAPWPVAAGYPLENVLVGNVLSRRDQPCYKFLSNQDIQDFVKKCATDLCVWRDNPTLESAQELRERLLEIKCIDSSVGELFRNGTVVETDRQDRQPSLTEAIDIWAWKLHCA